MADDATQTDVNDAAAAVFAEDDQDTSTQDSSSTENKPDAEEQSQSNPTEQPTETDSEQKEEENPAEDPNPDDTEETDKPQGKAEERKQQLNTEIRDLVSQRNALKSEIEKINSQVYQPATEDELVDQGLSLEMAAIESMKQREEMREFNNQVAEAQLTLESESQRVMNDFPMFNPDSDQFNKELAEQAAGLLQNQLITDPNSGQLIGSNISPYQLYKTLASAHQASNAQGQLQGQKATEAMLASADPSTSSAPAKDKKDPVQAIIEDVDGF